MSKNLGKIDMEMDGDMSKTWGEKNNRYGWRHVKNLRGFRRTDSLSDI